MRISLKKIIIITMIFMVTGFANFYALLPSVMYIIFPITIIILSMLTSVSNNNFHIICTKSSLKNQTKWLLLVILVVLGNQSLAKGDYVSTLRFVSLIVFCIAISQTCVKYVNNIYKIVFCVGFLNVLATYFFFFVPSAYSSMINIYGYVPIGAGYSGEYGYRVGIADHYSQNGVYIAIACLAVAAIWLLSKELAKKKVKWIASIVLFLSFLASILTSKRGPLLFSIISVVIVYYIINANKFFSTTFKAVVALCVFAVVIYFAGPVIPGLSTLLARFGTAGKDSETLTRFKMWTLAWECFKNHPIFGIGWFGFRYQHAAHIFNSAINDSKYMYLHAHNVYIQVLCERGIVGIILYIYILLSNLIPAVRLLKHWREHFLQSETMIALIFSTLIQVFYITYSTTGNCLYDMMFCFYVLAVGTSNAILQCYEKGK